MVLMISENFADLLDSRFRKVFQTEYEENIKESMIPFFFKMETTDKNYEKVSGIGGGNDVGLFTGSLDYDTTQQLYDKSTEFPERAKGMKIQRKLADDAMYVAMDARPRNLAVDVARSREKIAAEIFNGIFVGTGGIDGVPLCSSSHPYSPTDATTQTNTDTLALNATNIEATRRLGQTEIFNDRGEILTVNFDTILCTVYNEQKAWEVINSRGKVDTDINNRNFMEGRYKLAVWNRLSGTYPWFMMDSRLTKLFLYWWTRIPVEFNYTRDFDTLVGKWSVYFRENPDYYGWHFIWGHNATA